LVTVFEDQHSGLNWIRVGDWNWIVVVSRSYVFDWGHIGAFAGAAAIENCGASLMIRFVVGVGIILRRAFGSALDGIGNWNRVVKRGARGIVVVVMAVMLTGAVRVARADGAGRAITEIGSVAARTHGSHAGRSSVDRVSAETGGSDGSGSPVDLSGTAHRNKCERQKQCKSRSQK
jgi:hypothetical protein